MFCRNCGKELTASPEICIDCGAKPMAGTGFCPGCGAPTTPLTEICTRCGVRSADAARGKTWKTKTAGILAIVAGVVSTTEWIAVAVLEILALGWLPMGDLIGLGGIVAAAFVIAISTGIVAIVGGVFALKRKRWRLALAGSICAIFSLMFVPVLLNVPLAIAAIVLVVLGRGEFEPSPRLRGSCKSDLREL
jgi:hypothetical protein